MTGASWDQNNDNAYFDNVQIAYDVISPLVGYATATDDCVLADITYSDVATPGTCPQEQTIIRTWTATDGCGNSVTCDQTIAVEDAVAPIITTCPADVTVECDASTDPADTGTPVVQDNCDGAPTVTYSDVTTNGTLHSRVRNYPDLVSDRRLWQYINL